MSASVELCVSVTRVVYVVGVSAAAVGMRSRAPPPQPPLNAGD